MPGVTLDAALLGVAHYRDASGLRTSLRELDMVADVQVTADLFPDMARLLTPLGVRPLVDHCGRPDTADGLHAPGFLELLRWGRPGPAVVKLSGLVRFSRQPPVTTHWRPSLSTCSAARADGGAVFMIGTSGTTTVTRSRCGYCAGRVATASHALVSCRSS
jgi:hypothetical protein